MILVVILGVIIAIFAILFAFQNATTIAISLGTWQFEESLAIVLLITLGIGIIISLLLSIPTIIKRGWINSRNKRKITELEDKVNYQQTELTKQSEQSNLLIQNHQEILQAFSLTNSVTGFLNQEATVKLVTYLLQQIQTRINEPRYSSLCVFLLSVEPAKSHHNISSQEWENSINRGIAKRLAHAINPNSFLGVTHKKRFICLTLDLTGQQANEYSDYLIGQLTNSPLQKADGTTMPLKVYLGGAIADPADKIDSRGFLQQAEQNLEQAKEQKRNSVLITEIVTGSDPGAVAT